MMSAAFRIRALRAVGAMLLGLGLHAAAAAADAELPGEMLVRLRSTAALGPLLLKYELSLVSQFGARPIYRLKGIGLADVHRKIGAMALEPNVLSVEPNFAHSSPEARRNNASAIGTPQAYTAQWALPVLDAEGVGNAEALRNNAWAIGTPQAYIAQWAPQSLRLPEAHRLTVGAGVRVAVLDTGVDRTHPALAGRLLAGFDFVDFDADPSEVGSSLNISFGHGTHVAGLVALVAPGAQIMPLRVLDAEGVGNAWVLVEAMLYAVDPDHNPMTDDGAHVINMSLGSTNRTQLLDSVVKLAACAIPAAMGEPANDFTDPGYNADKDRCASSSGAVIVAAAGNDGTDAIRQYPAAERSYGLLAVGASNADARLAALSNFGSWVDLAAPGEGITSSVPGGGYGTWSGTSMAAPLAAGTAALVRALNPDMQAKNLARRLVQLSSALCGTSLRQVDAAAAVLNVMPPDNGCP
jgi:subtilisin family serine protease